MLRIVTSSNQGCNDAFNSCDFEHRIVFACNQLSDVQWYVCGLLQHATCVLKSCVGKSCHMTEKPKTSASFCAKQLNFHPRLCTLHVDVTFAIRSTCIFLNIVNNIAYVMHF